MAGKKGKSGRPKTIIHTRDLVHRWNLPHDVVVCLLRAIGHPMAPTTTMSPSGRREWAMKPVLSPFPASPPTYEEIREAYREAYHV